MGKWTKSLPEALAEPYVDRASNVLHAISFAIDESFQPDLRADEVRRAAAEVRAWRRSLGVESDRARVTPSSIRHHLRDAGQLVLAADGADGLTVRAIYLRSAEAHLREAARLLTEQIEGAE